MEEILHHLRNPDSPVNSNKQWFQPIMHPRATHNPLGTALDLAGTPAQQVDKPILGDDAKARVADSTMPSQPLLDIPVYRTKHQISRQKRPKAVVARFVICVAMRWSFCFLLQGRHSSCVILHVSSFPLNPHRSVAFRASHTTRRLPDSARPTTSVIISEQREVRSTYLIEGIQQHEEAADNPSRSC